MADKEIQILMLKGQKGDTGRSIESIVKTSSVGDVDTYTITYTDQTTATFQLINGMTEAQVTTLINNLKAYSSVTNINCDGEYINSGDKITHKVSYNMDYTETGTLETSYLGFKAEYNSDENDGYNTSVQVTKNNIAIHNFNGDTGDTEDYELLGILRKISGIDFDEQEDVANIAYGPSISVYSSDITLSLSTTINDVYKFNKIVHFSIKTQLTAEVISTNYPSTAYGSTVNIFLPFKTKNESKVYYTLTVSGNSPTQSAEGYATITTDVFGRSYISFNQLSVYATTGNIATFEIEINNVSYVSE